MRTGDHSSVGEALATQARDPKFGSQWLPLLLIHYGNQSIFTPVCRWHHYVKSCMGIEWDNLSHTQMYFIYISISFLAKQHAKNTIKHIIIIPIVGSYVKSCMGDNIKLSVCVSTAGQEWGRRRKRMNRRQERILGLLPPPAQKSTFWWAAGSYHVWSYILVMLHVGV